MSDHPEAAGPTRPADDSDARDGAPRWRLRSRWARAAVYGALVLALLLVGLTVTAVSAVRGPFPTTSGTLRVPGLAGEVTVLRDDAGVPQVYADTATDLFFAQGFVQAQDRFFQMDVWRHVTAGRLAEMFGEDALDSDKVVRTMGWRRVAEQEVARLSPEALTYLESFSAGVNAYLADKSLGDIALEYTLLELSGLEYRVEDWTPVDSVAWLKAVAWDLSSNVETEIDRAMMAARLSPEQIAALYPAYPYDASRPVVAGGVVDGAFDAGAPVARRPPPVDPPGAGARSEAPPDALSGALSGARSAVRALPTLVGSGDGTGSNAWVVDGEHSKTGRPILANDPHLAPSLPGIWYPMGLHCTEVGEDCPFDVAGFTMAGLPGVVIGHNRDIAWGFTNLRADVTDLFLEAVEGERYLRGSRWLPFKRRTETIRIAGADPFTFTVRSSVHGPLLSDVSSTYASVGANADVPGDLAPGAPDRGSGYAVALSWTALEPGRTAEAIFDLNRAGTWEEFRRAMRRFAVPSQNALYADTDGHIGYQAPGRIPVRGPANTGEMPSPGWDRRYDWTGEHVPFEALPTVLDPEEGVLVSANQAVTGPGYPYRLGSDVDYGQRSERIHALLEKHGTLSVADMSAIQLDTLDSFAPVLVPYLLDVDAGSGYYSAGQELLRTWDFRQEADSAAAAYYNAVWRRLLELTFADQLPESVEVAGGSRWLVVVGGLLTDPTSPWWDDARTDVVREARDDILREALRQARDDLTRLQSRRVEGWTWGHQHRLELENPTLGRQDTAGRLLNRGPWPVGGSTSVVNAVGWDASEGFEAGWVPTMRMVVSLGDLDDSTWVNLTGASGHAFNSHYTDQTDLWARGRTRPWAFTAAAVEAGARERLTLEPATGE